MDNKFLQNLADTGKYLVSGDYTDSVVTGDQITVKGSSAFTEYTVSGVEYTGGNTEISLEDEDGVPSIATGTIYVHLIAGILDMKDYVDLDSLSVRILAYGDELYVMGGKNDSGKFPVWRVKDNG